MNAERLPADATLEAMLARRGDRVAPDGLAADIRAAVEATHQRRPPVWTWLLPPVGVDPAIRRAWIVALAGMLLLAAAAAAAVGSELMRRPELSMLPSPTDTLEPTPVPSASVVPSAAVSVVPPSLLQQVRELAFAPDGSAWLATAAGLVHWDVAGDTATLYGQGDGLPTTDAAHVAVGPDGTAWASGSGWVGRFDGSWTIFTEFGAAKAGIDAGELGVGPDGAMWIGVTDVESFAPVLLRYDGAWHQYSLPEEINASPWLFRLFVGSDGVVWAGSWDRFFRFDDGRWSTYARAGTGLPRDPVLAGVGADGSVWVTLEAEGCVAAAGGGATCSTPAAGVARLRDGRWTVYTTSDGLPADEVELVVGPDGTVWATASGRVARFDGTAWATTAVAELADARLSAVDGRGTLWFEAADGGFVTWDGSGVARPTLPSIDRPTALPVLRLTELSAPTVTSSALGSITWHTYESDQIDDLFWSIAGTPYGPVGLHGQDLRWVSATGSLEGTTLPISPWRVTSVGDEVVIHGQGMARLRWDGSRWVADDAADRAFEGISGFVEQVTMGPLGTIVIGGERISVATDGTHFAAAAHPPDKVAGEDAARGADGLGTCPSAGGGSWPGSGQLGPAIATREGFVVLAAARVSDWNRSPLCTPLLWSSRDGSSWRLVSGSSPFGTGAIVQAVTSREFRHVAVGQVGQGSAAWVSDDGLSWRRVKLERAQPCSLEGAIPCTGQMAGVAASSGGWIAWSWDGAAGTSRDGETWEPLRGWPAIRGGYEMPVLGLGPDSILAVGSLPGAWRPVIVIGAIEP